MAAPAAGELHMSPAQRRLAAKAKAGFKKQAPDAAAQRRQEARAAFSARQRGGPAAKEAEAAEDANRDGGALPDSPPQIDFTHLYE